MKLKNKYINSSLLLVTLLYSTACHKFLDQNPISTLSDQTSWKTDADANSQVAGCYSLIRSAFNNACSYYSYGDLPTDLWSSINTGDYGNIYQVNWAISIPSVNTYDPKLKLRLWTPFYSSIQQSNRCLHFLNQMSDADFTGSSSSDQEARRNKYLAEAKFCRAFNYFYMARVWGDVPLDTSYQADVSSITIDPRVAQEKVLQSAISDLNWAKNWLSYRDRNSTDRVVRADKGTVFALLAHIYAWRGSYDSCRIACDSVIQQGGYGLVAGSSYSSIYKGQSIEGIFEVAQNTSTEALSAQSDASIVRWTMAAPYLPTIAIPIWQTSGNVLSKLYSDTTDKRYTSSFAYVTSGSTNYYFCTKYSNISSETANGVTYYLSANNINVFRLADIYLLRAEANAASPVPDYASAVADINIVRERAGIADLQLSNIPGRIALINAVTDERGRELWLEGSRYYDLVRNARLTLTSQLPYINISDFQKGKYYWPIDPSLMLTNSGLTQTPYWQQLLEQ
ncbi:MAG TPA: RagB/SusD family nutrient uptake outer membrane protein [Puia sp.]|nr:RagB/SusD family nutrient uptake outer membrane protein [Puia sp.]